MATDIIRLAGKPLEKLASVIKKGLGLDLCKTESKLEKDSEEDNFVKVYPLLHPDSRVQQRLVCKETKRQQNIDYINYIAAEQLSHEQNISEEPVEEDWIHRFFNIAEDISDEKMRCLWGLILAGEIKQPKSYSLRTLEFLKNISKAEAEIFIKFAQLKITSGENNFVYNQDNGKFLKDEFGITLRDRLLLTELGLIVSENNREISFRQMNNTKENFLLTYGNKGILLYRNENTPKQPIGVLLFTTMGLELSKLITQTYSVKYIEKICSSFKHENVKIEYGDLFILPNGNIILNNKVEFDK